MQKGVMRAKCDLNREQLMTSTVLSYGMTNRGLKRVRNEDAFAVAHLNRGIKIESESLNHQFVDTPGSQATIIAIADGMGGIPGGLQAAQIAIATFISHMRQKARWLRTTDSVHDVDLNRDLRRAIEAVQEAMHEHTRIHPSLRGMGTTLTACQIEGTSATFTHLGDSRAYLLREGEFTQLTTDHNVRSRMIAQGLLEPGETKTRLQNVIYNFLGGSEHHKPQAEIRRLTLQDGDRLLFCTDGLNKHISDEQIAAVLRNDTLSTQSAVDHLISRALQKGGSDNVTVVVANIAILNSPNDFVVSTESTVVETRKLDAAKENRSQRTVRSTSSLRANDNNEIQSQQCSPAPTTHARI